MTSQESPKVFIIVLNWNGWEDTVACVKSLHELQYENFHIVVVDNASTNSSVQQIEAALPDVDLLKIDENRGYAAGNNAGMRYAMERSADYVWILNNDTVVDKYALRPLVEKMEDNENIGLCGSKLIYFHEPEMVQALGGEYYLPALGIARPVGGHSGASDPVDVSQVEKKLDYIAGASALVSGRFIETVGLMQEDYFLYYEELDWAERGGGKFTLGFAPQSVVYHKHGASISAGMEDDQNRSLLADYYQLKNRLKFTRRFYPQWLPTVYLTVIYAIIKRLLKGQWQRAASAFKLMFIYNN